MSVAARTGKRGAGGAGVREQRRTAGQRILAGLEEAVRWSKGEAVDVRQTVVRVPEVDVRRVRRKLGLSQAEFAGKFGFTPASVKNWEQGRRRPEGPARVLLAVIDRHPEAIEDALRALG
jgi:putative transcriptional regulator